MVLRLKCWFRSLLGARSRREERHHHLMQAGRHLKMNVRGAAMHWRAAADVTIPIVQLHPFAIDQQLQLLAANLAERAIIVHQALIDGVNLEHVVAIGRELMLATETAAGGERHAVDVIILRAVFRHATDLQKSPRWCRPSARWLIFSAAEA